MLRIVAESVISPAEVMERAREFFGPRGLGLEERVEGPLCLVFSGGGGFVRVSASSVDSGRTRVDMETREWELKARDFARTLS